MIGFRARLLLIVMLMGVSLVSARSQTIAMNDLDGWLIEGQITREQVNQTKDRQVTATVVVSWSVALGPGSRIEAATKNQVRGESEAPRLLGSYRLGEVREVDNAGGGKAQWTLNDNVLVFTRSFVRGATRSQFTIARAGAGFTCAMSQSFAREDGGVVAFAGSGTTVSILSSRVLATTCRVSRRK